MAAGRIVVPPYFPARDRDFNLLAGALLYVYDNETTAKAAIYTNEGLTVLSSNPVVANSSGQFPAIFAEAGTEAEPVLYSIAVTTSTGASPGNPFVFDNYRPSVDWETAASALAEAAAEAAVAAADSAAADAVETAADLAAIEAIIADAPDAPSVLNKLNLNGDNVGSNGASLRANIGAVGSVALAASGGSALVGFLQSGTDATSEPVQTTLRRIVVCPEQFSGTDTEKVQAAFNSAGDIPGQNVARIVRFSDFYDTTATINVPAYVMIEGVGSGRSGLRPTMSTGPALRASVANNTSSYLCEWKDFGIDGTSATGSAYAMEFSGQKITTLSRIRIGNFDTSEHAVQFTLGCQSIILDQCQFFNNRLNEKIGVPYVGVSFPTTITHKGCIYEEGPSTGAECILLTDANGCSWIDRCVFQSIDTPVVFRVVSSASQQTAANHLWDSVYLEANGASHGSAYTWSFEGDSTADRILGCSVINSDIHGAAPGGGHVYAENTDLLFAPLGQNASGHTWYVDGGGNTRFNYLWANQYQLAALTFADIDGGNFRIWNGGAAISGYLSGSQNLWANTTHTFASIGAAADFAVINATGIRSNGSYLIAANTVLDVDGTNHRLFAPDGDPVFYAGATENLHRNATHRFSNQAVSVDYGIFSSVGLNLGAGLALQIGGTQVVGARGAAVTNPTGGAVIDAEARTAIDAILSRLEAHGLIAP